MRFQQFRTMLCLAGALSLSMVSKASTSDATINISKALNNSTITVSYSGIHASMVELSIDGVSVATRSLNYSKINGESDFKIDLSSLQTGENKCVIHLFDQSGRIIGTRETTITVSEAGPKPFFISSPKMGQSVQGPVQIAVGFNQSFADPYVSFFIDNQLKSMSNTPPFVFLWDTTRASNGWHTIQSWMVSDSNTIKSPLLKVFVNNPSGDTPRLNQPVGSSDSRQNPTSIGPAAQKTPLKATPIKSLQANALPPSVFEGILSLNKIQMTIINDVRSLKPVSTEKPAMAGAQHMMPTGQRVALAHPHAQTAAAAGTISASNAVHAANSTVSILRFLSITDGVHIPELPTFAIFLDGQMVNFDVQPSVDNGIPMTPLRYLIQQDGGSVLWKNTSKTVTAKDRGEGMWLQIGNKTAKINNKPLVMEKAPYITGSRTIVPLSFIHDALHVNVQYDKRTGHVLITSAKKTGKSSIADSKK